MKTSYKIVILVIALVMVILFMFSLVGCNSNTYKIDYCGGKEFYKNAKDYYKAGSLVELNFDVVASDTDYTFYLDGSEKGLEVKSDGNGFVISFTMPDHDVKLDYKAVNSMTYDSESDTLESSTIESDNTESDSIESSNIISSNTESSSIESEAPKKEASLKADLADDVLSLYDEYDVFVADNNNPYVKVVISTDVAVKNLSVNSLVLEDIDENGNPTYTEEEIYSQATLKPEKPLLVTITFYGDLASYGISYKNSKGEEKHFSIEMSGEDGHIFLKEF